MALSNTDLLSVSEAKKASLDHWRNGVRLECSGGCTIQELVQQTVRARFDLAEEMRRQGHLVWTLTPPIYRLAVNRFYYALYHATRSLVYYTYGGDDHQEHKVVPIHIPSDFPDSQNWQNNLKDARTLRNEVDYNPYPNTDVNWQSAATTMAGRTDVFVPLVRTYLQTKGCTNL